MSKDICETSQALHISFLKKQGFLNGHYRSGTMTWTHGWTGNQNKIEVISNVYGDDPHFRLSYTHTNREGIKTELNYRIEVATTPCYFGGKRYWFICPLSRDGITCGRRVGVLYGAGKYFGCRKCHDLSYQSQQDNYSSKWHVLGKCLSKNFGEEEANLRVKFWKGKPTKRYQSLLNKMEQLPSLDEFENTMKEIFGTLPK